jgi:hypothetical protein
MRGLTVLFLFILYFSSCTSQQNPPPAVGTMVELISGKSVRIYSIERVSFVNDVLPSSFLLRYETSLDLVDSKPLRQEVGEVWLVLQPKSDSSGDSYAMIKAVTTKKGSGGKAESFTYSFNKIRTGVWKMREPAR